MAYILSIETATKVSSVALHLNGVLVAEKESLVEMSHAESISESIKRVLDGGEIKVSQLAAVAVSKGPGSYTGLRIGVSIAKGICYSLNIPLIGVDTLKSMALEVSELKNESVLLCPMIDARRMEVYCQVFDQELHGINMVEAKIIDQHSFHELIMDNKIKYFGDGALKCREVLVHTNFEFIDNIYPKARCIGELAFKKLKNKEVENLAYFEPYYLKEFIAKKPSGKNLV